MKNKKRRERTAYTLRTIARVLLWIIAGFFFIFALVSGAEELGGGIKGVLMNSPNAIPFLALLLIVWAAYKWEFAMGIIITLLGLVSIWFFKGLENPLTVLTLSLPLIILGGFLIAAHKLHPQTRKKQGTKKHPSQ